MIFKSLRDKEYFELRLKEYYGEDKVIIKSDSLKLTSHVIIEDTKVEYLFEVDDNTRRFKAGDTIRHYTGGVYKILHEAKETLLAEEVFVYISLKDGNIWVRPKVEFYQVIGPIKNKQMIQPYRFTLINGE